MRNYILLEIMGGLKIPYRQKEYPYPLITILGDPISYRNRVIYIETEPVELKIEG